MFVSVGNRGSEKYHLVTLAEDETAIDGTDGIESDIQGSKNVNFTLRSWAKFLLQRHGK
jgi:hypothetical protein